MSFDGCWQWVRPSSSGLHVINLNAKLTSHHPVALGILVTRPDLNRPGLFLSGAVLRPLRGISGLQQISESVDALITSGIIFPHRAVIR